MRLKTRTFQVLHCPFNFANNPLGLSTAENLIGLKSSIYSFDKKDKKKLGKNCLWDKSFIFQELKRWHSFIKVLFIYDIIHFNFGTSLFPSWLTTQNWPSHRFFQILRKIYIKTFYLRDLWILKKLGKTIYVTYQGDDARQKDYCLQHFKITFMKYVPKNYNLPGSDEYKRWSISQFDKYADEIFSVNPDLLNVLPASAKFIPYTNIDIQEWIPTPLKTNKKKIVIIHAPTDRLIKGTSFILESVQQLKKEGFNFEFKLIENITHDKVKELYKNADLVIDQLLAGWYGGFAVELMALGKPVIAYIRKSDLKYIPKKMKKELPIINATPTTIYSVLKQYLTVKKHLLPEIGKKSRLYVEHWHDPVKVAKVINDIQ